MDWADRIIICIGYSGNDPGLTKMLFDFLKVSPANVYMCSRVCPDSSYLQYYKLGGEPFKWVGEYNFTTIMTKIQELLRSDQ